MNSMSFQISGLSADFQYTKKPLKTEAHFTIFMHFLCLALYTLFNVCSYIFTKLIYFVQSDDFSYLSRYFATYLNCLVQTTGISS